MVRPLLWWSALVGGVLLVAAGLSGLAYAGKGLRSESVTVADVPVEVVHPAGGGVRRPVVVIAHGYAGSGRLMRPFADTFARRGYVVALPDLAGHARNTRPLTGDPEIDAELATVVRYVRGRSDVDPAKVVLLGHSMGAAAVVRVAAADQGIAATVAISSGDSAGASVRPGPRRLLLMAGALEPAGIRSVGEAALPGAPDKREVVLVPWVEHVGVLYADRTHREAAHWFDDALRHRPEHPAIAARGRVAAGALSLAGLLLLVVTLLIRLSARVAAPIARPPTPHLGRLAGVPVSQLGRLAGVVVLASAAGGVGGWPGARLLPAPVSGYLVGYFACAGATLLVASRALGVHSPRRSAALRPRLLWTALTVAGTAAVVVPIQLGLTWAIPAGAHVMMTVLLALATALLLSGAHVVVRSPYSLGVLALVLAPLPAAALAGLAPGFLALVSPLIAALLAPYLVIATVAWRSGTPWWHAVPAGAVMLAWPVAVALPLA